jgi:hypothetical protein
MEVNMPSEKLVTVRVLPETLVLIQTLMREKHEKQHGLLKRIVEAEWKRFERQRDTRPDWNRL